MFVEKLDIEIIKNLPEKEKIIFLKALVYLSLVDEYLDPQEKAFIKKTAQKLKIQNPLQVFENLSQKTILRDIAKIKNRTTALELIKQLCFIGHSDEGLSDEEILFIGQAGLAMGLEIEKIDQISDWVVDAMILQERAKSIFEIQ